MTIDLQFYAVEESSGIKTLIGDTFDIGSLFKGNEVNLPISIYNNGTETAINPRVSIVQYFQEGKNYSQAVTWKKLSLDKNSNFSTSILLPDIPANSWMPGKDIYNENFSGYPTVAGTRPDQDWTVYAGSQYVWEVYSGYLQHNVDTQHSRAVWNVLPAIADCEFSTKITVRDSVYAGYLFRNTGDSDTGYIVLVQGQARFFTDIPVNEGVIQVWSGKFSSGIDAWTLLYQSNSIGIRGTHDYFKVKLIGNRFDFWYQNPLSTAPLYSFVDETDTYIHAAKPVLVSHPGSGSILIYFDDITLEVPTQNGMVWIKNTVTQNTPVNGRQYSIFKMEYGGV